MSLFPIVVKIDWRRAARALGQIYVNLVDIQIVNLKIIKLRWLIFKTSALIWWLKIRYRRKRT